MNPLALVTCCSSRIPSLLRQLFPKLLHLLLPGGLMFLLRYMQSAELWFTVKVSLVLGALASPWNQIKILCTNGTCSILFWHTYEFIAKHWFTAHSRSVEFWTRVLPIYVSYKATQFKVRTLDDAGRDKVWAKKHHWGGQKIFELCTNLRGFYLKDGQFLGSRADFMPNAWVDQLAQLQDRVPPIAFHHIEREVCEAYSVNSLYQLFRRIDRTPLASATIAQVHRAWLFDDRKVVIKAQYLDQERLCALDLKNLRRLAEFLQATDFKFFDLVSVVEEFENQMPLEFDFIREADMMLEIKNNLAKAGLYPNTVYIPHVERHFISKKVLVIDFVEGTRIDDARTLKAWGISPRSVIEALGEAYGQMMLLDAVFHADPHSGNIIIMSDGRPALIDFGNVKRISDETRRGLCAFYLAMANEDIIRTGMCLFALGIEIDIDPTDPNLLETASIYANGLLDTRPLPDGVEIDPFSSKSPLKNSPIKKFPPELFMVLRMMGLLRALCVAANVEFAMSKAFEKYAMRGLCMPVKHGKTLFPAPSMTDRALCSLKHMLWKSQ